MLKKLSDIMQNINSFIQNNPVNIQSIKEICIELNHATEAGILITDKSGKILCSEAMDSFGLTADTRNASDSLDSYLNDQFINIVETKSNLPLNNFHIKNILNPETYSVTIIPLYISGERIGTTAIFRTDGHFSEEDVTAIQMCSVIISLIIRFSINEQSTEIRRKVNTVKASIRTLSYSELEAVIHIFEELDSNEGFLVASRVADKIGITRSVFVNALRKLESARVIESKSLGMKGTHIKILNEFFLDELNKLK